MGGLVERFNETTVAAQKEVHARIIAMQTALDSQRAELLQRLESGLGELGTSIKKAKVKVQECVGALSGSSLRCASLLK